jgi:hyaluronan synthase
MATIQAGTWRATVDRTLCVLGMVALSALILYLKSRNVQSFWYQPHFQAYSLLAGFYVLSRVALALHYRAPPDVGLRPTVSVIVAVKNEERAITDTVRRVMSSDYPKELYEVLVVDDGSTDRTWEVLEGLRAEYPTLRTFRFSANKGKRYAMALGAESSQAEILVYMDSDSFVEPDGLRQIVQPFADPKVGAVAGHCNAVLEDSFISKMEAVRYYVSQRILKAAESVYWSVTCCPGPFSAYRREAVMRVLEPWRRQRFLGTEATFGDDRSLTNFVLRDYRVVYHAGAVTATPVPGRWPTYLRQQLRWKKSWVRETTVAARRMWRRHPVAAVSYYMNVLITVASPVIAIKALMALPTAAGSLAFVPYMLGLMLMYLLMGLVYRFYTLKPGWYYGVFFAFLYIGVLAFQNYYAMFTVRRNHWGTR